jgi:hypothetical protein
MNKDQPKDGETKVVNGITFYWSKRLKRWVTVPERAQ